uniref:SH2 domain-containing protein n=1 Tax=Amphimedon queenslandica TaxID=400682 RepID=A0A1X7T8H7_AMPQE
MLERVIPKKDGTFLVRPSSQGHDTWAISLISGNSIRHFKFFGKDGQFETGNRTFDSMVELVDFYKQNPIYAGTKLKYPINEEILNQKYPTHEFIDDVLPYRHNKSYSSPTSSKPMATLVSSPLSIDQLVDVIDLLKRSGYPETRWQDLGLRLGLHKNTLDAIERNHPGDVSRCLTECLSKWLRKADNVNSKGGATFDSLSDALRSMDEIAVADKLDQERRNAMATCIFDSHCHNLSQSLCDPEKFEANPSLQCETATYVFDWRPDEKKLKDITDILSKTSGKFVKIKFIDTGYSILITCSFPHSLTGAFITILIENLDVLIKNGLKKVTIGCCLIWEKQKLEEMEQLLEEDIDMIKVNQGDISEDPYVLQKKEKQLTAYHSEDSGLQSLDTSFAIVTLQLKKENETNKRLEEKLQNPIIDLEDQKAALAENKREIEYLQEQISSTSVQLLMKREENKKEKKLLEDEEKLKKESGDFKLSENLDTLSSLEMQPWFHENVSKADADAILDDFKHTPGAFIVRRNFVGYYFLSFVHNFKIRHLSISEINYKEGKINYRISGDFLSFVSIVDLIDHYCLYHINIDQISHQKLTVPISKNK